MPEDERNSPLPDTVFTNLPPSKPVECIVRLYVIKVIRNTASVDYLFHLLTWVNISLCHNLLRQQVRERNSRKTRVCFEEHKSQNAGITKGVSIVLTLSYSLGVEIEKSKPLVLELKYTINGYLTHMIALEKMAVYANNYLFSLDVLISLYHRMLVSFDLFCRLWNFSPEMTLEQ